MLSRCRYFVLLAFACAVVAPPNAGAAIVGTSTIDGATTYSADVAETNRVTVTSDGTDLVFDDAGATIVPERGCVAVTQHQVRCPGRGNAIVSIDLGDGDDTATVSGLGESAAASVGVDGGTGNDQLTGGPSSNTMSGGRGTDVLQAGSGTSSIDASNTFGAFENQQMPAVIVPDADRVICVPAGREFVRQYVSVDETDSIEGPCGQVSVDTKDAVVVRGTDGPDILSGSYFPTRLDGLGGDDQLYGGESAASRADGGAGNDTIEAASGLALGDEGNDTLRVPNRGNRNHARLDGGPGNDNLRGAEGPDRLVGGTGTDVLTGSFDNDYFGARDGERDVVQCGAGRDRVVADGLDQVSRDCESVSRAASRAKPRAATVTAAGSSTKRSKCRTSSTTGGARAITRTSSAVVFEKRDRIFGCVYSGGRIAALLDIGGGIHTTGANKPAISGRYVAYMSGGTAIGDEIFRVLVWDLREGRVLYAPGAMHVHRLVLKKNGSIAWVQSSVVGSADDRPIFEVRRASVEEYADAELLDRGRDVAAGSLGLAAGSTSVTWARGGAERSAPLR